MTDAQHTVKSLPQKKASRIPTRSAPGQRTKTEDKPYLGSSSQLSRKLSLTSTTDETKIPVPRKKSGPGQDKKDPSLHPPNGLAKTDSKENIAPVESKTHPAAAVRKHNIKSNMGYMELKRSHQELTTELQAMEGKSRDMDHQYHIEVEKLLVELQECKQTNAEMKEEIHSYQEVVKDKNVALNALQSRLEDIKIENEKMAAILDCSRVDAVSGHKIDKAVDYFSAHKETKAEIEEHTLAVNNFISQLESTVLQLQEQSHDHRADHVLTSSHDNRADRVLTSGINN